MDRDDETKLVNFFFTNKLISKIKQLKGLSF